MDSRAPSNLELIQLITRVRYLESKMPLSKISMSKKNVISQGNYVGLTIILEQVGQEDLIYRHELMYQITLQYISCDRTSYWDNKLKADITDSFNVKTENWLYENPSEAMAKFQQIRNQVRGLGEFRNLNKGKIPDYRDPPS